MHQKCDHFAAFAGAFAKYFGEREGDLAKKRGDEWETEQLTMYARLCGGGNLLKALGSVADYLTDTIFYLTNDTFTLSLLVVGPILVCLRFCVHCLNIYTRLVRLSLLLIR